VLYSTNEIGVAALDSTPAVPLPGPIALTTKFPDVNAASMLRPSSISTRAENDPMFSSRETRPLNRSLKGPPVSFRRSCFRRDPILFDFRSNRFPNMRRSLRFLVNQLR